MVLVNCNNAECLSMCRNGESEITWDMLEKILSQEGDERDFKHVPDIPEKERALWFGGCMGRPGYGKLRGGGGTMLLRAKACALARWLI